MKRQPYTEDELNYLAGELLRDMGTDNGVVFHPCKKHRSTLVSSIAGCRRSGFKFTPYRISTIAYGEERDQEKLYKQCGRPGKVLHKTLNEIFDGCKACRSKIKFEE